MRSEGYQHRRGLTRIELVVVVVIALTFLGVVVSLLPWARESSDLVRCRFNLKQIGEAALRFHGRQHFLPASRIDDGYATWAVFLGPDLSLKGDNPLSAWDGQKPYAEQTDAARQVLVPQYYCPARRRPSQLSSAADEGPDGKPLPGA